MIVGGRNALASLAQRLLSASLIFVLSLLCVMRMNPRAEFEQVLRQAERQILPADKPPRQVIEDVTDVAPKGSSWLNSWR